MMQFYREYNKELTFVKPTVSTISPEDDSQIVKPSVSQLKQKYDLPITQISWSHNIVIMQRVKNIDARYWYMTNHKA